MLYYGRRSVLRMAALGGAGLGAACLGLARAESPADTPRVAALRGNAFLVSCDYANVLGLETDAGVLLVNGVRAQDAPALLQALDDHTGGAPLAVAYNTHWHWDHTGSNEALARRGARLIAHENTRLWLGNDFYVDWQDRHYSPRPAEALPTETFYETHRLTLGDETVDSGLMFQAITDGDIYVLLREHNILAAGDLVADGTFPVPDPVTGGWIGGLVDAQARLLELADEGTLIIPGQGAVQRRADLAAQHAMLVEMRERIFEFVRQGKGPREMLEAGVADGLEEWGDPTRFVMNVYPGLGPHYRDVDGVV